MKKAIAAASALALVTLAGCSAKAPEQREVTMASTISAPPLFSGQIGTVSKSGPNKLKVGDSFSQVGLMRLRSCNTDNTDCKLGIGKLKSQVTVVALNTAKATVLVDLQLDVDRTQNVGTEATGVSYNLSDKEPTLHGSHAKSETVSVDYNRIEHFDLPYGVAFKLCVEAQDVGGEDSGSACKGQEAVLSH